MADAFPSLQSSGPSSLQLPESLPSVDGEPHFVNASDEDRFRCPLHNGLLIEPQQTKCGHRFCKRCLDNYLAGADKKQCPVGDNDCEDVSKKEVVRDNSIIRDLKKAMVHCPNKDQGCTVKCRFSGLKEHLTQCEYEPVPCIFASRGCREKVLRGKVKEHQASCPYRPERCSLCQQEVNHSQLQAHKDNDCPEATVGCPFGCENKKLKRKEIEEHKKSCPVQPVDCTFKAMGCTFTSKRETVEQHEKDDLRRHLQLVTEKVAALEITSLDTKGQIQAMTAQRDILQSNLQNSAEQDQTFQTQLHRMESQIKDIKIKMVTVLEKVFTVERKLPELAEQSRVQAVEQNMHRIQQKLTELERGRERGEQQQSSGGQLSMASAAGSGRVGRFNDANEMATAFTEQLNGLDRQLSMHDIRMAEMDLRFQLLETASYDGKLIWKIRDYTRRKADASNGRTLSLYSQPFYTNRFGYKMCARVYLNGDGMGKGSHMSLFFVIMRGEYDALLVWPFRQKVTLTLLDQSAEKRHLTDSFQPDSGSSSFQKPVTEMNVASGCPLFVSHTVLESQGNGYLKDDTIFIRIVVDSAANAHPF